MKIKRLFGGLVSLCLVAALAVILAPTNSQAATAPQAGGKEMGMHGGLQAAVESLNLTDDQKAKVKDIFAKAKMKELHTSIMAKLNEVLTPDQQTELKTKMEAAKAKSPSHQ